MAILQNAEQCDDPSRGTAVQHGRRREAPGLLETERKRYDSVPLPLSAR